MSNTVSLPRPPAYRDDPPPLNTRAPTGEPSWPLLLVDGGEKVGKSWLCAEFTASQRLGHTYWLDWFEGQADDYGAISGARYSLLRHDGTWRAKLGQVAAAWTDAARAHAAGEAPIGLVVDSMTAEWDELKGWGDARVRAARDRAIREGRRKPPTDPDAELTIPQHVWNDIHTRHYQLMRMLMAFPGVAIMTARGKDVTAVDSHGQPIEGKKEYKIEGHKNLGFDASAVVRLSRDHPPTIVGARSVHAGIRPGVDRPRQVPDLTLDWLVFDQLLRGTRAGQVRELPETRHDKDDPTDWHSRLEAAGDDVPTLQQLWREATHDGAPEDILGKIRAAGAAASGQAAA